MLAGSELAEGAAELGLALDSRQIDQLLRFAELLQRWNRVHNLTAIEPGQTLSHHLLDSLSVAAPIAARLAAKPSSRLLDVGAGGGLPGIPLAIARPDLQVTLIDSIAKKTAFLLQAKAELGLANLAVATGRVEDFRPETGFDVITSRAFSDLKEFVTLTRHLLKPGGRWLAMKGLYPNEELALLPNNVKVSADHALVVPGLDASRHVIVLEPA